MVSRTTNQKVIFLWQATFNTHLRTLLYPEFKSIFQPGNNTQGECKQGWGGMLPGECVCLVRGLSQGSDREAWRAAFGPWPEVLHLCATPDHQDSGTIVEAQSLNLAEYPGNLRCSGHSQGLPSELGPPTHALHARVEDHVQELQKLDAPQEWTGCLSPL